MNKIKSGVILKTILHLPGAPARFVARRPGLMRALRVVARILSCAMVLLLAAVWLSSALAAMTRPLIDIEAHQCFPALTRPERRRAAPERRDVQAPRIVGRVQRQDDELARLERSRRDAEVNHRLGRVQLDGRVNQQHQHGDGTNHSHL